MKVTIARKMTLGFASVLGLIIVMFIAGNMSARQVTSAQADAAFFKDAKTMFTQREVDHMGWLTSLQGTFLNNEDAVGVQMNHELCALGKWMYGPDRDAFAARDPELARLLSDLEDPHENLHETAHAIDQHWEAVHPGLQEAMYEVKEAHDEWAAAVTDAIISRQTSLDVQTDPTQCGLGHFLKSREFQQWASTSQAFKSAMANLRSPHDRLHQSAIGIGEALQNSDFDTARQIFQTETVPALDIVKAELDKAIEAEAAIHEAQRKSREIITTTTAASLAQVQTVMHKIEDRLDTLATESGEELKAALTQMDRVNLLITLIAIGLASFVGVVITRSIVGPVRTLLANFTRVSDGDLTVRSESNASDEIGELTRGFDDLTKNLNGIIIEVADAATEVAGAATEVASASEQMSAGIEEQSSQLDQVTSATTEMAGSAGEVARQASEATKSASEAGQLATQGGQIVRDTVDGMRSIENAVQTSSNSVSELGKRGEQIGEIINTINDIADQTNLLALNAAIEAARAGEHGRGFAVVADEVRKLAERTTQATEEVSESIRAIQTETEKAVREMAECTEQVHSGVELATTAGDSLGQIVESSNSVQNLIQSIAAAAEEQGAASDEVNRNIEAVGAVSREAAAGASQSASAASQLSGKAESLQALVRRFTIDNSRR